jgi:molecular chaperone GrpE
MINEDRIKDTDPENGTNSGQENVDRRNHTEDKSHSRKDKKSKHNAVDESVGELHAKCDELNDKYLRLYSEFDNYRKRTLKERIELGKTASEDIILSLLPVLDDIERALQSTLKTGEMEVVPKEGIELIYQKFRNLLTQKGLEVIPSKGEEFNVDFHDALSNIPSPSEDMRGKVVEEVGKGYMLNGKVIRYSKVIVGN